MAMWVYVSNDKDTPIYVVMGQRQDVSLATARTNNTYASLTLGTLPSYEMKLLYRVIAQRSGNDVVFQEAEDFRGSGISTLVSSSALPPLSDNNLWLGNASGVATPVTPSGDVTMSNAGVMAIASDVIVNADIKSDAAIAISKLAGGADGSASQYFKMGNMMIQWGIVTLAATSGDTAYSDVTFPVAFKAGSTPVVTANMDSGFGVSANMLAVIGSGNPSNSGFRARCLDRDGVSRNFSLNYYWIAIGLIA